MARTVVVAVEATPTQTPKQIESTANVGPSITTYTILRVPYYDYSIIYSIYSKSLFSLLRPLHYKLYYGFLIETLTDPIKGTLF